MPTWNKDMCCVHYVWMHCSHVSEFANPLLGNIQIPFYPSLYSFWSFNGPQLKRKRETVYMEIRRKR